MTVLFIFLLVINLFIPTFSNFIIYGNGNGELRIKRLKSGETVKVINTQVDEIRGGLAIDFRNDLIFFADGNNIYKIFLVDDQGKHRKSGKGELFMNSNVNHFETLLYGGERAVDGLFFHDGTGKLYTTWNDKLHSGLYTIDTENGSVATVFDADDCIPLRNPLIYKKFVYFTCPYYAYKRSLYKSDLSTYSRINVKIGKDVNITSFNVDRETKRAFYTQRSTIRMFDPHPYRGIILADSAVTDGVNAIAVYGKYVLWSSVKLKRLYIGKLEENMYFIPMRNIQVMDGSDDDPIIAHHIVLF